MSCTCSVDIKNISFIFFQSASISCHYFSLVHSLNCQDIIKEHIEHPPHLLETFFQETYNDPISSEYKKNCLRMHHHLLPNGNEFNSQHFSGWICLPRLQSAWKLSPGHSAAVGGIVQAKGKLKTSIPKPSHTINHLQSAQI